MRKRLFVLMTLMMVMLPLSSVQVSAASTPTSIGGQSFSEKIVVK